MAGDDLKVSDASAIAMPIRNLISIVLAVAVGVWAWFGVQERLNKLELFEQLIRKDVTALEEELKRDIEKNNEFRIKWPRGEMGSLPADNEQFMLLEHMAKQVEKVQKDLGDMMHNKVNINRLQKDVEKILKDVESLKDRQRGLMNGDAG
jgi:septation ring formation regulator EzrA|tara:strand:+ start:154 stop:603 length:450 start_codon:yes stop_codon:yes gene_type:complete